MAYGQFIEIKIEVTDDTVLFLKSATLVYGKFHEAGNKDKEVDSKDIVEKSIYKRAPITVYSCGRSGSASGTEGGLYFEYQNQYAGTFLWDCPWSGSNKFYFTDMRIKTTSGNPLSDLPLNCLVVGGSKSGAIKQVTLSFSKP